MEEQLADALAATWTRNADAQLRRVAALERALVALLAGALDDPGRQVAVGEAHKLAGSLGSFGLGEGSRLASQLETALSVDNDQPVESSRLAEMVVALRSQVEKHDVATGPRPTARPERGTSVDVLLVDDDEVFADFVLETLRARSYDVCWLPDGESARTAVSGPSAALRARLILLDVEMPGLDGFRVLEQLAQRGVTRQSAVIMLTRRSMTDDIVRAHRLGVVDYLAKPLDGPMLVDRVDRALNLQTSVA